MNCHAIRKRNGRLHVYDTETGIDVYSPPDFVIVHARDDLHGLVAMLDDGADATRAAAAFEATAPRRTPPTWPFGFRAARAGVPEGLPAQEPAL